MREFRSRAKDNTLDNKSAMYVEKSGYKSLIVVFGGIKGALPFPVFEFFRSLEDFSVDKIFIRDFAQCWYHAGIKGHSKTFEETLSILKSIISEYDHKRILFVGNSSGGYAAILFGVLLRVSRVLAFAPQTFLNRWLRFVNRDNRWGKEIRNTYLSSISQNFFDLKKVVKQNSNSHISIFYDQTHRLDRKHAERLSGLPLVTLVPFGVGGHNLIKALRESGDLREIIRRSLEFN